MKLIRSPSFKDFPRFNELIQLREQLYQDNYLVISSNFMVELLMFFGASMEDLDKLKNGVFHNQAPADICRHMSFRKTFVHRMDILQKSHFCDFRDDRFEINCPQKHFYTEISKKEISDKIECEGRLVNTVRSGTRKWPKGSDDYQTSTIPYALSVVNSFFLPNVHQAVENLDMRSMKTIHGQAIVKVTKDSDLNREQQPTPEGVHQDTTEISSVLFIEKGGGLAR